MMKDALVAFIAAALLSFYPGLVDMRAPSHVAEAPKDCREVTAKGETAKAWFLMSGSAVLPLDQKTFAQIKVGQTACGPWKDPQAPTSTAPPAKRFRYVPPFNFSVPLDARNSSHCMHHGRAAADS